MEYKPHLNVNFFSAFHLTFLNFRLTQFEPWTDTQSSNALKLFRLIIKMGIQIKMYFVHFIFSDEAHNHLSGFINKQNGRIWANDNPRVIAPTKSDCLVRFMGWQHHRAVFSPKWGWSGSYCEWRSLSWDANELFMRLRKFGPSDGGVPPRRPFGRYFVPYIIEPYHIIIIKRNDNNFLNNLCFIQNQHRPFKFNHPL